MYFENFYEDIGVFDTSILDSLKSNLFDTDLTNPLYDRVEYCFKDGGRLILPLHFGRVRDYEYFPIVKPLINLIQQTNHPALTNTIPFRIEISIIEPNKSVKWHMDQHIFHKFSERIHIPVITNSSVEFVSKWFMSDTAYKFSMLPGHIYRYNNRVLHTVRNNHDHFRCHVIIDFIHRGVFDYFMARDILELGNNTNISPGDEIYYLVNHKPQGVEPYILDSNDHSQIDAIKKYRLLDANPDLAEKILSPQELQHIKSMNKYE